MLEIGSETFDGTFPFTARYHTGPHCRIHYIDEGKGEPVVMLHGDPTWGYLWRHLVSALSPSWRCVVPDHMGMGKSDVPMRPYPYRLEHHIANVESLVLHLDLKEVTLVVHDWGGPVGLGVAARCSSRIKRLVLMNTWAFAPWPGGALPRLLQTIRSDRGEKFVLERNGYLEPALRGTTHRRERLTETVMGAYRAPFPSPASRAALLCWSRDIPVSPEDPSFGEMKRVEERLSQFADTPTLLVWGMLDPVLTEDVLRRWQRVLPNAETHELLHASHFLQEDEPDTISGIVRAFLSR